MRRAISWEYCPPRSTTRTGRSSRRASSRRRTSASTPVIGRLFRDRDVVRMALAQARAGDAHEPRLFQLLDRRRAGVAHRLAQPADELADDDAHGPLVRNAALDPLGDQVARILHVTLEIAVLGVPARLHRAE